MQNFTINWKHSLRIKLFVIMSLYLLLTVLAISWQNGKIFWDLMTKQNSAATVESTKKASATLANLVELWSSTIYSTMHTINSSDKTNFQNQIEAVLSSNKEFVSFSVFRMQGTGKSQLVASSFTPYLDSPLFESIEPDQAKARILNLNSSLSMLPGTLKNEADILNLRDQLNLDAIQIQLAFQIIESNTKYLAFLVVSSERIRNLTELKNGLESFIVFQDGTVFMSSPLSKKKLGSKYTSNALTQIATEAVPSALNTTKDSEGFPLLEAAMLVPRTKLAFVVQKNASQEYEHIRWQIRQIALVSWMFLLVSFLAVYIASGRVTRQIKETLEATLKIAAGDLSAHVVSKSQDEVGILGQAVNHMAERIKKLLEFEIAAARQEKELKTAQTVQQTLFKANSRVGEEIVVTGHFEPASECAGDWWFDINISDHRHLVIVADATGHGAPAALIVAVAFSFFQTTKQLLSQTRFADLSPRTLLEELNRLLVESGKGKTTMTMFIAEIDSLAMTIRYANAGHIAPLLIPRSREDMRLNRKSANPAKNRVIPLLGGGVMLGFDAAAQYADRVDSLSAGDRILFYTDGLIECLGTDGSAMTPMDLRREIAQKVNLDENINLCDSIVASAKNRLGHTERNDDITVVVAEIKPQASVRIFDNSPDSPSSYGNVATLSEGVG